MCRVGEMGEGGGDPSVLKDWLKGVSCCGICGTFSAILRANVLNVLGLTPLPSSAPVLAGVFGEVVPPVVLRCGDCGDCISWLGA